MHVPIQKFFFTVMEGNILATWTLNLSTNNDFGSVSYFNISCDIRIGKKPALKTMFKHSTLIG